MENNNVVIIKLDRDREIRYGHKALKTLSAITGKKLAEFSMNDFDLNELEKILYCGLLSDARRNGETLKMEDMEDLLDEAPSYQYLIEKMQEAFEASFGGGEVEEGKEKN